MSWDLIAVRETTDENGNVTKHTIGEWAEVKALVSSQLDVEWEGPFWCALHGDGYSIEINVGSFDSKDGDPVKDLSFNVRGGGDPLPVMAEFCKRNELTLHDLATGEIIDPDKPSAAGFEVFQAHRDAAVERAAERHGPVSGSSEPEAGSFAAAAERAQASGYLRDQPFANMEYTKADFCNNFVAWNDELLVTGSASEEAATSWRADLDGKGYYQIPDGALKAPGPPLWYDKITRIEVERDRPSIRVRGKDSKAKRLNYSIRFADGDRKRAFVETLVSLVGREYRKDEGVSPGVLSLMAIPFVFAALVTAVGYWLFSATVARWIAIAMVVLLGIAFLGARSGKPGQADHYVYDD